MLKVSLMRTPGIDMTQTISKQGSNYLILRAIRYVSTKINYSFTR